MTRMPDDDLDDIRVFHPEEDADDLDAAEPADEPKPALDAVTAALRRGDYPRSTLIGLSDLTAREAGTFKRAWAGVDDRVREAVVSELNDLAEERVDYRFDRALLATLTDPAESMHVRARALESASILGGHVTVMGAIDDFFDDDDAGFRSTAIYAMGRSLQARFLPTILNETSSDDAEIRYEAARAAGFLGDTEALPVLAELARDEDAEVRQAAINAMGEIGGTAAHRYLRRLAEEASDTEIELIEAAMEDASIVRDPLLLDDEP